MNKILRTGAVFSFANILFISLGMAQPADLVTKANAGNAEAQSQLGYMHRTGNGAAQDYSKAFMWYRMAAEQGDVKAQGNLGLMYLNGLGVQKDVVLAYALTTLAAVGSGNPEIANKNRTLLERQLTQNQISEGRQIASNWKVGLPFDRAVLIGAVDAAKQENNRQINSLAVAQAQIMGIGDLKIGISEKEFLALPQTAYNLQNRLPRAQIDTPVSGVRVYHSTLDLGINNFYFSTRYSVDLYFYNDELVKIVLDSSLVPRERIEEALIAKYGVPITTAETKKDICVNQQGKLFDWKRGRVTGEWRTGETRGVLFTEFGDCAVKDASYTVEDVKKSESMYKALAAQRKQNVLRNSGL